MRPTFRFYPLTLTLVAVVMVLCLMPIEDPPLKDVHFIDKWTHMALFGGISGVIVIEMALNGRHKNLWIAPVVASLFGGLVEVMQAKLTTCRSGEWLDFAADAAGALLVFPLSIFLVRVFVPRNEER